MPAGDSTALSELIRRHQDRLFRAAFRVLTRPGPRTRSPTLFATVWARCGNWRGDAAAATWIFRVAYRVVLDHARTRRRWWRVFDRTDREPAPDPAAELADRDHRTLAARRLDEALRTLTPDDRALVHLHYFEGQSLAEIGAVLGATRDALKMRLSRARARLKEALGDGNEFG